MPYEIESSDVAQVAEGKYLIESASDEKGKDIAQQVAKKGVAAPLGAYGDLLDFFHAQTKERLLPGQEALAQAEFEAPETALPFLQDDDILPHYARLPAQSEVEQFIEMLGGPGEAKTEAGRIAGRGAELAGGVLPFGAGAGFAALQGAGGLMGQLLRELGYPTAGTATEIGTAVVPLAGAAKQILTKKPTVKPSGLPERKFERLKKPTKVSPETLTKATNEIEKDVRSLTSDLLKDTNKSYKAMIEDPEFQSKIGDLFGKVAKEAKEFPESVTPLKLAESLGKEEATIGKKGLTLSDTEKVKRTEINRTRSNTITVGSEGG